MSYRATEPGACHLCDDPIQAGDLIRRVYPENTPPYDVHMPACPRAADEAGEQR